MYSGTFLCKICNEINRWSYTPMYFNHQPKFKAVPETQKGYVSKRKTINGYIFSFECMNCQCLNDVFAPMNIHSKGFKSKFNKVQDMSRKR